MTERRIGKFYVYVKSYIALECDIWPLLLEMRFVPTRVEYLYSRDAFEYEGMSPLFRPVKEGEIIPEYSVTAYRHQDKIHVSVEELSS